MTDGLVMWTLYENTFDYPDRLVVRRGVVGPDRFVQDRCPAIICPRTIENSHRIFAWMHGNLNLHWIPRLPGE